VPGSLPSRGNLKAVVLDVDGTLYRQGPLRRQMLSRLLGAHLLHPLTGLRTFRAIHAYRRAQERLRGVSAEDTARRQLDVASESSRLPRDVVALVVERWIEQEPLPLLRSCVRPGTEEFLGTCRDAGMAVVALSDYPPDAKLGAMGLKALFSATFCAQSPDIGIFKPDPKGLRVVLDHLGVPANQALYVGDRVEVDAAAAEAAGIACAIVSSRAGAAADRHVTVADFGQLRTLLFGN
jgi:FMN phosphatase YigB (HAD superfamily)